MDNEVTENIESPSFDESPYVSQVPPVRKKLDLAFAIFGTVAFIGLAWTSKSLTGHYSSSGLNSTLWYFSLAAFFAAMGWHIWTLLTINPLRGIEFSSDYLFMETPDGRVKTRIGHISEITIYRGLRESYARIQLHESSFGCFWPDSEELVEKLEGFQIPVQITRSSRPVLLVVIFAAVASVIPLPLLFKAPALLTGGLIIVLTGYFGSRTGQFARSLEMTTATLLFAGLINCFTIVPFHAGGKRELSIAQANLFGVHQTEASSACQELDEAAPAQTYSSCSQIYLHSQNPAVANLDLGVKFAEKALSASNDENSKQNLAQSLACAQQISGQTQLAIQTLNQHSLDAGQLDSCSLQAQENPDRATANSPIE